MEGRVMGIYIKGFKPQDGLYVIKDGVIRKYKGNGGTVRPYELVEVKEPHGRLIDADEIVKDLRHDVAVDQDLLDYEELTDVIRETTQVDKDIKQNAAEIIESLPTVQFEERTEERTETHACDLISRQFGRLTVIDFEGIHTTPCGTRRKMWRCRCECGNESVVAENNLKNGTTKSCGCWKHEKLKEHNTLHGGSNDRLYGIWKNMKRRCDSPNDKHYKTYGGKGVKVCEEWSNNYQSFKEWAYANGYDDSAEFQKCTLDRVDNDGDYEPSNCRWVDRITQANNTSKNHHVELNGIKMTIAEFARAMNISKNHAWYYIDKFEREVMNGQQFDKASGGDRGIDSRVLQQRR